MIPTNWIIAGAAALAIAAGTALYLHHVYSKGEAAGAASVTNAVQTKTIEKLDGARRAKEAADEKAARTPYDAAVDGLR